MAYRIALGVWGLLGTAGAVVTLWGGTLGIERVAEALAGLIAMVSLWLVVKLPWDLYFAARYVQLSQSESVDRELAVPDHERVEARSLARRLLGLCVGLHLAGALISGIATVFFDGLIGPIAAGAFILTMGVRPLGAMVTHIRRRLGELRASSRIPREDARSLDHRLARLEGAEEERAHRAPEAARVIDELHRRIEALHAGQVQARDELKESIAVSARRHRDDVESLSREFERSIEKLTSDQALLSGIRAFLTMVRDAPA